jgi:TnpA family transposase
VADQRRRIEAAGNLFRRRAKEADVIREGRLRVPRARRPHGEEEDEDDETEVEAGPRLPGIDVVDLLWEVHQATGFLDAFRLEGRAPHAIPEEERRRLGIAVILALGTNVGIQELSRSLGRGYGLGRLRNFAANYVTVRTLRESLGRIVEAWDRLGLGRHWGPGTACSVDGRAVSSYARNLVSQHHFRRGKVGVTVYWAIRDDHLAASIRLIGNQEWESWFILDDLMHPAGGKPLEVSTGDTHGQHLAAFGLANLLGKQITVRFRQLGQVKIYGPSSGRWCGLDRVGTIDWSLLRRAAVSIHRLAAAVRDGRIEPSEILRRVNIYDEDGVNVAQALRELGKMARTEFILGYATDPGLRDRIQRGCQRAENWNSFQASVFLSRSGRIGTNNPRRRDEIGLAMSVLMDAIVFHNAWRWGPRLQKHPTATPVVWRHVRLLGRYRITKRPSTSKNGHDN